MVRKYGILKGIGTVSCSCTDYEKQPHTKKLNNVIYFIESPEKILSATELAYYTKDDDGTWIKKQEILYFYLGFWEVQKCNSSFRKLSHRIRD